MLGDMLGLAISSRHTVGQLWEVVQGASQSQTQTLELSVVVAGTILLGRKFAPRLPVALFVVLSATVASATLHFSQRGIAVVGPVAGGLPSFSLPDVTWNEIKQLLPVAASCCVMILAQSAATSRVFADRYRETLDEDADILGLAAANAIAGVSGAFVVNGSPTQTALAESAGSRSQLAQQTFAGVVLLVLLFLTGPLQYLPRCVLAAVVFTIGIRMVDWRGLEKIRSESPGEFILAIITTASVVIVGVEQGILLAIALSLFRHVRHSYRPYTVMLSPDESGRWMPVPAKPGKETRPGLIVYRFGADLFYANRNRFVDEVRTLIERAPHPVRWFVIDAGAITDIDYSAAASTRDLVEELAAKQIKIVFGRVSAGLRSDMARHGIIPALGDECVCRTLHEALELVKQD
jgi:MFS superfamily sulfate permease-like transporter